MHISFVLKQHAHTGSMTSLGSHMKDLAAMRVAVQVHAKLRVLLQERFVLIWRPGPAGWLVGHYNVKHLLGQLHGVGHCARQNKDSLHPVLTSSPAQEDQLHYTNHYAKRTLDEDKSRLSRQPHKKRCEKKPTCAPTPLHADPTPAPQAMDVSGSGEDGRTPSVVRLTYDQKLANRVNELLDQGE
jgi:hypothetical protein